MQVQIRDGNLIIAIPLQTPTPSASGKKLTVATTRGNRETTVQIQGKNVIIGVNAYIDRN
jgi:hypothetical protein